MALLSLFIQIPVIAQVYLNNPSFEGQAQDATVPAGWIPCQPGTTPDILPGPWGVYTEPSHGHTFAGLITRQDGTWESIGQRLNQELAAGECFQFKIDLAHSRTYAGYLLPVVFKVYVSGQKCDTDQLIYETGPIEATEWSTHTIKFIPAKAVKYLTLEAYFDLNYAKGYKGNLLLDNLGPIKPCSRAQAVVQSSPLNF